MYPNTKFRVGQVVYNVLAKEEKPLMIVSVTFTMAGHYYAVEDEDGSGHSYFEQQLTNHFEPSYD